jgi:hypothetical protein
LALFTKFRDTAATSAKQTAFFRGKMRLQSEKLNKRFAQKIIKTAVITVHMLP